MPWSLATAILLGGLGLWLLLPRARAAPRALGLVAALAGLGLLGAQLPGSGDWIADLVFYALAGTTLVSAGAAVSLRNPVYCAVWFGVSLLGTAGLLLCQGAQFLAAATVIVYAGAIVVTFLFILMLAQPTGRAPYDRVSWEATLSAATGAAIVAVLTAVLASVFRQPEPEWWSALFEEDRTQGVLAPDHVAALGHFLFGRYLIAVEVAGLLLLAALVGAAVMVAWARANGRALTDGSSARLTSGNPWNHHPGDSGRAPKQETNP